MAASAKGAFDAAAIERPHYFPYRVYGGSQLLDLPALVSGEAMALPQGERLRSADFPDDCFLLMEGTIASYICTEGTCTLSAYYLPGGLFLQLSALAHLPAALEYEALQDCTLRRISGGALKAAMMADSGLFDHVMRTICYKMYSTREQQRGAKLLDVRERVYIMLLGFAKDRGIPAEDGWTAIDWKLTQQDMGTMLRVNRVTVNTALQELYDAGLVRKAAGRYQVRDATGLLATVA